MNKRAFWGSVRFEGAGFQGLLEQTRATIVQAMKRLRSPKPYISFSGGKDSTVLAAIVLQLFPKMPVFWFDDELEYPETVHMMRHFADKCAGQFFIVRGNGPHAGWFHPWSQRPYYREPFADMIWHDCKNGVEFMRMNEFNLTFLGTRGFENRKRMGWLASAGPTYFWDRGQVRCCPMWNWTSDDIWAAIGGFGLGYNKAYDKFEELRLEDELWRVGPLPLVPRRTLLEGWPFLLKQLEKKYNRRWSK